MAVMNSSGGNYTYNVGSKSYTQSNLNNNMSGNNANAIYYATHSGSMSNPANTQASNPGAYVTVTPVPTTGGGGSSSKAGSGSGGSGSQAISVGGGGTDYASMINGMLEQQRAAAQAAYNASRGRLEEAWSNTQNALRSNLDNALANLQRQYDYGSGVMNDDAKKSLREAYINYMLNKKNLNQGLSAMGVSGGATESSMANMHNNYGNSRNGINQTLADNLADLLNNYQNNVASANQTYNSQYADAMNNYVNNLNGLESALANNMMSSFSGGSLSNLANYAATLAGLQDTMAKQATQYTPTENTMAVDQITTSQGNNTGSVTDYAKWQAMVNNLASQGATSSNIIQQLRNNGASLDTIFKLMGAA